jgi:hypothetical protein
MGLGLELGAFSVSIVCGKRNLVKCHHRFTKESRLLITWMARF